MGNHTETTVAAPSTDTKPPLDTATRLAYDRTSLAHERTLVAWVRTATSLITFGFTIYKYFQIERIAEHARISEVVGPRGFA